MGDLDWASDLVFLAPTASILVHASLSHPGSPEGLFLAVPRLYPLPTVLSPGLAHWLETAGEDPKDGLVCVLIRPPSPALGSRGKTSPSPELPASGSAVCSWMYLCPGPLALGTRLSGSGIFKLLILLSRMLLMPWFKFFFKR